MQNLNNNANHLKYRAEKQNIIGLDILLYDADPRLSDTK